MEMTKTAKELMQQAIYQAKDYEDNKFRPEHILMSIILHDHNVVVSVLRKLHFDVDGLFEELSTHLTNSIINNNRAYSSSNEILPSPETKFIVEEMQRERDRMKDSVLNEAHIMLALLRTKCMAQKMLIKLNLNYKIFKTKLMSDMNEPTNEANIPHEDFENSPLNPKKRRGPTIEASSKTPALDGFCIDISKNATENKIDPVVGRENEIKRVTAILARRKKNNPVLIGEPGVGKAQPLDAKILTPNGWTTMGEISVGDFVLTPEGKTTKIIGVYPQGVKDIYRMTFKDGRSTEACGEHLWKVYGMPVGKERKKSWSILNTVDIKNKIENTNYRLKLPLVSENINRGKDLDYIIDPYLMGLLLGDGHFGKYELSLTTDDIEIPETVEELIGSDYKLNINGDGIKTNTFRINLSEDKLIEDRTRYYKNDRIHPLLGETDLLNLTETKANNKFIPEKYKNGSLSQKISLIQGLMDSYGTVTNSGTLQYSSASYQLIKDIQELIWSIGGIAKISDKQTSYTYKGVKKLGQVSYILTIRYHSPKNLFLLKRKKEKVSSNYQYSKTLKNNIVKIELIGRKESKCIMVEDDYHLYITDNYIVTHNTSIVEGLALLINSGDAPKPLLGKKIYALDLASIVAGTKYRGQFEERMKVILTELKDNPDIILFIDELHTLVGAGNASGSLDASNIFKPALARGEIQVIGATTLDEFRENIETDGALTRRFQQVLINEPSLLETVTILKNIKENYETYHNVSYDNEIIELMVKLADRYISDRAMPDKAIDILDEVGASTNIDIKLPIEIKELKLEIQKLKEKMKEIINKQDFEDAAMLRDRRKEYEIKVDELMYNWEAKNEKKRTIITSDMVETVISTMTGIPLTKLTTTESNSLKTLEDDLKKDIIGQDEAVKKISKAIRRSRLGIRSGQKPIGSFIFLGPTGVGKCFTADTEIVVRNKRTNLIEKMNINQLMDKIKH